MPDSDLLVQARKAARVTLPLDTDDQPQHSSVEATAVLEGLDITAQVQLVHASIAGQIQEVETLLSGKADPCMQSGDEKLSPLMLAAAKGHTQVVEALLQAGAPWNALDSDGHCAGDHAAAGGHATTHEVLLNSAVRAELVLSMIQAPPKPNLEYLQQKLIFQDGKILDANGDAVMMGWETPLMEKHADILCSTHGDVLNVGFGLGIIDRAIQSRGCRMHHIIEAHPDVHAQMLREGWDKKANVTIHFGRWQDVLPQLPQFDAIFFDTYGEHYHDLKAFHEELPNLLRTDGVYTYFNGLAASTNAFFHAVYCRLAELELQDIGLHTKLTEIPMDLASSTWAGVKRAYWVLPVYRLPVCRFPEGWAKHDAAVGSKEDQPATSEKRRKR